MAASTGIAVPEKVNGEQPSVGLGTGEITEEPAVMPSEVVKPTRSDTLPQQAATQPGDGTEVHESDIAPKRKASFKERVVGAAQKTRGTLLGKPELKEHGKMVIDGKAPPERPKKSSSLT